LFHKAIAQSGGGRWDASSLDQNGRSAKSAYSRAGVAMDVLGVKGPDAVSDLRRMDWRDIVLSTANSEILNSSSPFIDGQVLTEQLPSTFERGTQAQVPFMVGSTTYEGIPLRRAFKVSTAEVLAWAGQDLEKLAALYPERGTRTDELFADYIWGDANFVEPARKIARDAAAGPSPVYYYVFDYLPPFARLLLEGTPHGLDVLYTFGSFDSILRPGLLRVINPENYAVSETMRTYWTNFAKTGNPNGGSTPWPRFDKTTNESMVFGIDGARAERDYLKERLDIINRLWTLKPPPQS
jgi:para-nitrobenzyl esterase